MDPVPDSDGVTTEPLCSICHRYLGGDDYFWWKRDNEDECRCVKCARMHGHIGYIRGTTFA